MMTSDQIERFLLHCLRIDGYTADAILSQHQKFFFRDGIRPSCFHRKFQTISQIKTAPDLADQTIQLVWLKCGRCPSPDIDRVQFAMIILCGNIIQFLFQCVQICINLCFPGSQRIGSKRTVQTGARAKRYANIQTVSILIIQPGKQCPLTLCNGNRQIDFLIGCQIGLFHIGSNLFFCFSLIKHLHRNLRRTDTGQCTPWQRLSRLFLKQAVQMFLQCILCLCTIGKIHRKGAPRRTIRRVIPGDGNSVIRIINRKMGTPRFFLLRRMIGTRHIFFVRMRFLRIVKLHIFLREKRFNQRMNIIFKFCSV